MRTGHGRGGATPPGAKRRGAASNVLMIQDTRDIHAEAAVYKTLPTARERRETLQVGVAVAEHQLSGGEPFEPMADLQLVDHGIEARVLQYGI